MGKLFIVPTPVGNLEDITLRAISTLKMVDLIFAEDTRKSKILLHHYEIQKPIVSFHKDNEHKTLQRAMEQIRENDHCALISDAGTPGISDPGFLLVRECIRHDITVETLPGAVAFIPALINSGLPCERFVFEGFLPQKKGRKKRIRQLAEEERTLVFYESPYKLVKTLKELTENFGHDRSVSISKEISKIHETTIRGKLGEVSEQLNETNVKGEFVIVLEGNRKPRL